MRACPAATVLCNEKCRVALGRHFDTTGWKFRVVHDGESLSIGRRTLTFVDTPMVHWPESMFTFLQEDGILFSMDAFGQHLATSARFDDEADLDVVMAEAKTYYANILMLYGRSIARTLERAKTIPARLLAPSHGIIWRRDPARILAAYRTWVSGAVAPKVVVLYDTMWQSTETMAKAIADGAAAAGAQVQVLHARANSLTEIATEMLDAACVACGSATLNMTIMPELAAALTYLQGLRPTKKAGLAFGSYGWSRGGTEAVEAYLKEMHVELLGPAVEAQFVPDAAALEKCRAAGRLLAERARAAAAKE
jgi:flavorubredoxin